MRLAGCGWLRVDVSRRSARAPGFGPLGLNPGYTGLVAAPGFAAARCPGFRRCAVSRVSPLRGAPGFAAARL
jgi:hypothetical protein